ncbi:FG-GAP-like repeat-containing protein [Streptomyces sp. NPDC051322]|uniref:FG-GAP-like repeat-containing protein n=1 Tax=Streptomyces sp. NPDC051322 TaxID=3154645 RepID=UPI00344C29AF
MVLGGAGAATYAMAGPADGPQYTAQPRKPAVHSLKLESEGARRKGLDQKSTGRFSAVLLTWNNPKAVLDGTAEVRYRGLESGAWSGWQKLPDDPFSADGAEGARAGQRGGTASLWTDDANGVQVRVVGKDGSSADALPAGMDVKLLDPGTDPKGSPHGPDAAKGMRPAAFAEDATPTPTATDAPTVTDTPTAPAATGTATDPAATDPAATDPAPTGSASPTPEPSETVPASRPSTVVKPPIITQAQWGASTDYDGTPSYGTEIKAAVIHHTGVDSDNTVSCADSRARMRTIQQEHFSRGYYDIGYNFVVDRCGQIFEGRSGGMDLPVVGAHDIGFNTNTVGISYIGNFESAQPTKAGLDAIARVVAWKFGMYGIDPTGKVTLESGSPKGQDGNLVDQGQSITLPRVFGHRDTNATLCPGKNLYPKLPTIAKLAALPGVSHALPTTDYNGDGLTDLVTGTPKTSSGSGSLTVVPGGANTPATAAKRILTQSSSGVPGGSEAGDGFGAATAWGDVNGDGVADLAIGVPGEDDTSGHADGGAVTVMYGPALTSGVSWGTTGITRTGAQLGSAVTVGDFDADGKADVFAAGIGSGGSWNVHLSKGAVQYGMLTTSTGKLAYEDATTGDFNRDGYQDVALNYRDASGIGRVVWFKGTGSGLVKVATLAVKGGRSIAAGDVNGNGYDDIVIGQPYTAESGAHSGGQVTMVPGSATGLTTTGAKTIHQDTSGVPGAAEAGDAMGASVAVGDYNLDGYADVLAGLPGEDITRDGASRKDAGAAVLLNGSSAGLTGSGASGFTQDTSGMPGASESGDHDGSAVLLGDISGYGRADLAISAEGENAGDGVVAYLSSGSSGISVSGAVLMGRGTLGAPAGAHLGQTLTP